MSSRQLISYASPPAPAAPPAPPAPAAPRRQRLHPVVWLLFADAAVGVAAAIVLMLAYENVPIDQEPPPLTIGLFYGLLLVFAGLAVVIVAWLAVLGHGRAIGTK